MANYRAVANGNWSAGATWAGGAVPPDGAAHDVYANGFTVTIDQNVNVNLLSNAANAGTFVGGGTAGLGGGFTVNLNGITISAASIYNGTNTLSNIYTLSFTGTGSPVFTLIGNLLGMSQSGGNPSNCYTVNNSSTGTLNIYGNITGGNSNGVGSCALATTAGTINIYSSNITGGAASASSTFEAIRNLGGSINIFNSVLNPNAVNYAVNNSSGTLTSTNCVFNASASLSCYTGAGTNRLSGTFVSASNGQQPIASTRWFLNTAPTNSYIQHALDGVNSNSFTRYYTADSSTALNQAAPTDVRSGVAYGISNSQTGRLTVPARGSVALSVNYGPSMPFTATRSGTTATATLAYSYPLVVGDQITVTGASNSEWNSTYTIASVVSGTSVTFVVPATHSAIAGAGAVMQTTGTAVLDPAAVATAVWGAATRTLTTSSGPTAVEIRQELDSNSTKLANLDATVSSRLAPSGTLATVTTLTNAPTSVTPAQIRAEMDANSTKLANLDTTISSRLATSAYTAPTSAPTAASVASAVWGAATKTITGGVVDTLTNAPTVPTPAQIATQVRTELGTELGRIDAAVSSRLATAGYTAPTTPPTAAQNATAVRTELATELGRVDAAITTRATAANIPAADITAIKAKTDALNVDRVNNTATTAIVGNLLAQANS